MTAGRGRESASTSERDKAQPKLSKPPARALPLPSPDAHRPTPLRHRPPSNSPAPDPISQPHPPAPRLSIVSVAATASIVEPSLPQRQPSATPASVSASLTSWPVVPSHVIASAPRPMPSAPASGPRDLLPTPSFVPCRPACHRPSLRAPLSSASRLSRSSYRRGAASRPPASQSPTNGSQAQHHGRASTPPGSRGPRLRGVCPGGHDRPRRSRAQPALYHAVSFLITETSRVRSPAGLGRDSSSILAGARQSSVALAIARRGRGRHPSVSSAKATVGFAS